MAKAKSLHSADEGGDEELAHYERDGLTLLTQQPADLDYQLERPSAEWQELKNHLEQRMESLRSWRLSWWEHWALLAEYLLPRRYHWLITPNTMTRGLPINQRIVDPTGVQAMNVCAQGLMNNLASPSRPWFKLKLPMGLEPSREMQLWLDEVETRLYSVMAGSNFYSAMTQMFEDLTCFGTAPVILYEDERDVIRCYNPCAGEYFVTAGSDLRVEGLYRQFVFTASQVVEMFGLDNCPPDIVGMWREKSGSLETEFIVAHAIEPNFAISTRSGKGEVPPMKGDFLYREIYWIWGSRADKPLSERGFNEAPFVCPRWKTTSNDAYGRSVAMDVLPDVMTLQVMTKRRDEGIEKHVRPPLLASIELKNEPASQLPGHLTYVAQLGPDKGMRPIYTVNPDLTAMIAQIQALQERVKKGFFNDLFQMLDNLQGVQPRNELEINERKAEKLQVLGPMIENFQKEAADPVISRVFGIMHRRGMIPKAPEGFHGVPMHIEYLSQFTLAQKAASTSSMERLIQMVGSMVAVYPEAVDKINSDAYIDEYADRVSAPHKILRDPQQIAQIRAQKAAAAKQQQQQVAASHAAQVLPQAAQQLSQTDLGGGQNALSLMLNGNNGGGAA